MAEIKITLRRILLPLDVSRDSLTALEAALGLAAALHGEISGIFVEDKRLVAAASLPFAREIGSLSGISRQIRSEDIEQRFRALADKARSALAESAGRRNIRSSFRTLRGNVTAEILAAAAESDLIVLGKAGWSLGTKAEPGTTCMEVLSSSPVPVLVVERGTPLSPPIVVADDGTDAGRRAVDAATQISHSLGWKLAVLSLQAPTGAGDLVFKSVRPDVPRLFVLPMSLSTSAQLSGLKCPVLFVP